MLLSDAIGMTRVLYTGKSNYLFHNLQWWADHLGADRPLSSITADDIDEGIGVLMSSPVLRYRKGVGSVPGKGLRSPATVNRYVGSLATMLKLLRLHRRLPRSFVSPITKGTKLPESSGRTLTVSVADVRRLIDAARLTRNQKLPALIACAATTGLRKGSLQQLRWGQVDLKARTIDIAVTKNSAPIRSVLPPWACLELARIAPTDAEPHWEVFGRKDFRKAWFKALELADLPQYTFHHCRHMAASVLAQSGASVIEVMQVLGHKTPSMSMRYSHLNTAAIEKAVSRAWG